MTKAHIIPFVAYLLGATFVGAFEIEYYPLAYSTMVILVGILTWRLLRGKRVVVPHWRILPAILVGLFGIALWIALCELHLEASIAPYLPSFIRPADRVSYNPFEELDATWKIYLFIVFRLFGLSVVVPIVEEIFWRGFLLRWIISEDWEKIPLGTYSRASFWGVVGLFTLAHPEWLAAASYCALLNGLLYWRKDLWSCIVAHGVSNLTMGIYVLATGTWWLW